jgi:hypothetical protein
MNKKKIHKTLDKITKGYEHKHPLIFFVIIFNAFVFGVLISVHFMNAKLDTVNAKRILFNQPDPEILAEVDEMLDGYPMQEMAPYIATQNKDVVAYLIAIAKKESAWGKRTPKLNGQECYNYWGYRGKRERMGSGGHTCFDSPKDAVHTVSRRIKHLIKKGYDTPEKMVVWKCGYSCAGHSSLGVDKWIEDVDYYYQQFLERLN